MLDACLNVFFPVINIAESEHAANNRGGLVDDFLGAEAELGRLLGGEGEVQTAMGLNADAFYQAISQMGSYSDLWKRHLAPLGLQLEGSANDLWTNGGLMYPPPAR